MTIEITEAHTEAAVALGHLISPAGDKDEMIAAYAELLRSEEARQRCVAVADEDADPAAKAACDLLIPGLLAAEHKYPQMPRQWPKAFWRSNQPIGSWDEVCHSGLAQLRPPGSPSSRDPLFGEIQFQYRLAPSEVSLSVKIPRTKIADGSYACSFADAAISLCEAFAQTEEVVHANVLNTGMVYNAALVGDGCPLFSDSHPYRYGTYSNRADFHLSEAGLEAAAVRIRRFPDFAGLQMLVRPRKLIVPVDLEFAAARLLKGMGEDNPAAPSEGYQVLDYLIDSRAWFLLTNINGLVSVPCKPFQLTICIEDGGLVVEASQSYGAGHRNPRGCFGSFPE